MARVATKGTTQASASKDQMDNGNATKGKWTAGKVHETTDSKLSSSGSAVLLQAQCTFTFVGSMSPPTPPTPVTDSSTITLSPKTTTTLQAGQASVLRDGDSESDMFGNTVKVSVRASYKLTSS